MALLQPDATFRCYRDVTADFLRALGVEVLILDIDNTLAPYEQPLPDGEIIAWLEGLASAGVRAAFLSNNHGQRVKLFNGSLALPVLYNAHKPLARKARRLMRALGGNKTNTAFLGDQIFTDILTAHRVGAQGFLVPPIKDKTDALTRLKRHFEKGVLKRYYKRNPQAPDVRLGSPLAPREDVPTEGETK